MTTQTQSIENNVTLEDLIYDARFEVGFDGIILNDQELWVVSFDGENVGLADISENNKITLKADFIEQNKGVFLVSKAHDDGDGEHLVPKLSLYFWDEDSETMKLH